MKEIGTRSFALNFKDSIRALYHGVEPVAYRSIDEVPGPGLGLRFVFASNWPDFSHFLTAREDEAFARSPDGVATVRFDDTAELQIRTLRVRAVKADGTLSETYTLNMALTPQEYRQSENPHRPNNMLRMTTTPLIHPAPPPMDDWNCPRVTDEEIAFATEKWGHLIDRQASDYENAKALAKTLIEELWPHRGQPSAAILGRPPPFEQYQLMVSGQTKGFCTSFAAIFECACKSFGILCRRIAMAEVPTVSHRLFVQICSNHCTTEIFDRQTNQWILVDLTYQMLGAFLGHEGPLTAAEFHLCMNQPRRRERLHLLNWDLATKTERMLPFSECPRKEDDSYSYEGWNTIFGYRRI